MIYGWVAFLITADYSQKLQPAGRRGRGAVALRLPVDRDSATDQAISWQGHLCGALAGILAAWLMPKTAATRAVRTASRASLGM